MERYYGVNENDGLKHHRYVRKYMSKSGTWMYVYPEDLRKQRRYDEGRYTKVVSKDVMDANKGHINDVSLRREANKREEILKKAKQKAMENRLYAINKSDKNSYKTATVPNEKRNAKNITRILNVKDTTGKNKKGVDIANRYTGTLEERRAKIKENYEKEMAALEEKKKKRRWF